MLKPMPQLTPAPAAFFDKVAQVNAKIENMEVEEKVEEPPVEKTSGEKGEKSSDEEKISPKSKSKIVKRERFWEYEEIDEKPKEKQKRKLVRKISSYRLVIFDSILHDIS